MPASRGCLWVIDPRIHDSSHDAHDDSSARIGVHSSRPRQQPARRVLERRERTSSRGGVVVAPPLFGPAFYTLVASDFSWRRTIIGSALWWK